MTDQELIEIALKNYRHLIQKDYWISGEQPTEEDRETFKQLTRLIGD
jgi:hypothetical protein